MRKIRLLAESALYLGLFFGGSYLLSKVDAFEWMYSFSRSHESWELDEFLLMVPVGLICLIIFSTLRSWDLVTRQRALKITNRDLLAAKHDIEILTKSKELFLAAACHELKSPLIAIVNALQVMEMSKDEEDLAMFSDIARRRAEGGLTLVKDVLEYSKLTHGGQDLERKPFSLRATLDSVVNDIERLAQEKGLEFSLEVGAEVPEMLLGSEGAFRLICVNLLGNAVKYTDKGEVTATCRLTGEEHPEVLLTIADTGSGIAEDKIKTVFDAYDRGDQEQSGLHGIGLGLYMTGQLVRILGWRISVDSTIGKGTRVMIWIPVPSSR